MFELPGVYSSRKTPRTRDSRFIASLQVTYMRMQRQKRKRCCGNGTVVDDITVTSHHVVRRPIPVGVAI